MTPYVVKPGDHLKKIAFALRFDADTVWNDPKNADLKSQRDPNQLHPGDLLYVPDKAPAALRLVSGTSNKYQAKVPTTKVHLCFQDASGPFANEQYTVDLAGQSQPGTTDGSGGVDLEVPIHTDMVQVTFPKRNVTYPVHVGDMDPIEEPSGLRKRLQHLGLLNGSDDDADSVDEEARDTQTQAALSAFQKANGLPTTGTLDDATKAALKKAHGS